MFTVLDMEWDVFLKTFIYASMYKGLHKTESVT